MNPFYFAYSGPEANTLFPKRADLRKLLDRSLEIYFDDQLVWAPKFHEVLPSRIFKLNKIPVVWTKVLEPYLIGKTRITIKDGATGEVLDSKFHQFDHSNATTTLLDNQGKPLFVNKYGRLGYIFAHDESAQTELVEAAYKLQSELTKLGYKVAICSATLLGAVRNGAIIPQDDDFDFLVYNETSEIDQIRQSTLALTHDLEALGYVVLQHSGAHTQVLFLDSNANVRFFIDFFQGFFKDGVYNQPFVMRDPKIRPSDIFPFSKLQLNGREFLAPWQPEVWLKSIFGPNYLIPDPSWHADINPQTTRLFDSWFGVGMVPTLNFWVYFAATAEFEQPIDGNEVHWDYLKRFCDPKLPILDIGSGNGIFSRKLIDSGYAVIPVDYCHRAIKVAEGHGVDTFYANIVNPEHLLTLKRHLLTQLNLPADTSEIDQNLTGRFNLSVSNSLHQFTDFERKVIFQLAELAKVSVLSFDINFDKKIFSATDPLTWHLDGKMFSVETSAFDFGVLATANYNRNILQSKGLLTARQSQVLVLENSR
jgi:SAM-dependent methyltransferase